MKSLDYEDLKYGTYKVKITCNNEQFINIFTFNENNEYTHYDLLFCNQFKKLFNIEIELDDESKYNSIIYDDEKLCSGLC